MQKVTRYVAKDGTIHESESACEQHELRIIVEKRVENFFKKKYGKKNFDISGRSYTIGYLGLYAVELRDILSNAISEHLLNIKDKGEWI